MAKNKYQKTWELNHPDKVKEYNDKYMKSKTQAKIILEPWGRDAIDIVKPPSQTYGNWIRQLLEEWAKSVGDFNHPRRTTSTT